MSAQRIQELLPHAGSMCLLEDVLEWDERQVVLETRTHERTDHPLRRAGHLDMLHLCEYGAQAMAVHGGLLARRAGRRAMPGMLVSLRDVGLAPGDLAACAGPLRVRATRLHGDDAGWQYAFEVTHGTRTLAAGRAAVVLRSGGAAG